jgi:hypothetical protein
VRQRAAWGGSLTMAIHLSKALWRAGLVAALVVGALMALPFGAGAQTANGSLTASLAGNNGVAITISGVTAGNVYNLFACTVVTNAPTPPACQIATTQLTAASNGMASGTVGFNLANYAIAEVFAQNNSNNAEQYSFTLSGGSSTTYVTPATVTTTYTTTPTCAAGTVLTYVNSLPTCTTNTNSGTCTAYSNASGVPVCIATTASTTCSSYSFIGGFPVCTSNGATTTCATYVFVNGMAQCSTFGTFGTNFNCGGYSVVNGMLVCTTNGLPFNFGFNGGICTNVVLVNGVPTCADNGLPFVAIPGCISYTFTGGIPVCILF